MKTEDRIEQHPRAMPESSTLPASERGNEEFEREVLRNRPQIYRFLLASLRDPDLADILTQECFLKAYRNWPRFRAEAQVSTWLMRIAINLQKDYWRSRRMEFWRRTCTNSLDVDEVVRHVPASDESPERSVVAKQQVASIWRAVPRLTEKGRTIFLLRIVEELSFREIADVTGMPIGTVKTHFTRSINKIRETLAQRSSKMQEEVLTW